MAFFANSLSISISISSYGSSTLLTVAHFFGFSVGSGSSFVIKSFYPIAVVQAGFYIAPGIYFLTLLQQRHGNKQSGIQHKRPSNHQGLNQLFGGGGGAVIAALTGGGGGTTSGLSST
jgi:hypothetical protein